MCLLVIWSDFTIRKCTRSLHTSECANSRFKKKNLFISIKVQLITISSVIPYISETNSTSSSLKKKKKRKKRRENEREGEGEERRGKERKGEDRESDTRNVPPSPDAFPSTKLGNNTTPIKGRLGKNTTPTGRGPTEQNQNPQADPLRRRQSFDTSFHADSSCTPERIEDSEYGLHRNGAAIYKKAKALRNLCNRF